MPSEMRLTDLDARFWEHRQGVNFQCPLCREGWVCVPFANPVGGGEPIPGRGTLWQRTGETIDALTLTPSVNAEGCCDAPCPGWHGWVRDGRIS